VGKESRRYGKYGQRRVGIFDRYVRWSKVGMKYIQLSFFADRTWSVVSLREIRAIIKRGEIQLSKSCLENQVPCVAEDLLDISPT
jgi:hypothetical protein